MDTEIELQRDIYDFRDDEIENFIANMLKPKQKRVLGRIVMFYLPTYNGRWITVTQEILLIH